MTDSSPPLVTAVLPTYQRGATLEAAVKSVAEQTYRQLELVIVDDASTDDTGSAVDRLRADLPTLPITFVRHEENRGGGAARNTGVRRAKGALVAFLDSDDLWSAEKLSRQVEAWLSSPRPERTVVYCPLLTFDGWRTEVRPRRPKALGEPVGDYLFVEGGIMQTSCLLLPRDLALAAPFDETLTVHQDLQLVLSLEAAGAEFVYVDEVLVRYSTAPDTSRVSGNRSPQPSERFLLLHGQHLSPRARLGFEARYLAMRYGRSGQPLKGVGQLLRALRAGAITPTEFAWYLARTWVPEPVELRLRRALRAAQGQRPAVSREGRR